MSDRLSLPLHPTLRHPRTGDRLRALDVINGRPLWPIMGASEPATEVGAGSNAGGAGETKSTEGTPAAGSGESDEGRDPQKKIKALEEEKDRHFRKAQQAEQEREELQKKLKEYEDKDKSELERATGQVEELKSENASLKSELEKLRVDNSFFVENSIAWHDPADAKEFVLRELGEVKVDSSGRVVGLKEAIDKVAKAKPYLVKPEQDGNGRPPASGNPPKGNGKGTTPDAEELRRKYPSLRNR